MRIPIARQGSSALTSVGVIKASTVRALLDGRFSNEPTDERAAFHSPYIDHTKDKLYNTTTIEYPCCTRASNGTMQIFVVSNNLIPVDST